MESTEHLLLQTLKAKEREFSNDKKIDAFIEADKNFSELVDKGLATRRGYNLMSVDNVHRRRFTFNCKH